MPSWILAPDVSLYILSYGLIYIYLNNRQTGLRIINLLILLGIIAEASYLYLFDLPPFMDMASFDYRHLHDHEVGLHTYTVNYISPYLIGLMVGIRVLEKKFKRGKQFFYFMVISCMSSYALIYYIPSTWRWRTDVSRIEKLIFGSLSRCMMSYAVAGGFFYQAVVKPRAFSTRFNSNKVFVVLGRFAFAAYLGHFMVMYYDIFTLRAPLEFTSYNMMVRSTSVLIYGHILGFMIHVIFEAPFIRLSKMIFPKKSQMIHSRPSDIANNNMLTPPSTPDLIQDEHANSVTPNGHKKMN